MCVKRIVDYCFDNSGQSSVNIVDLFLKLRYNNTMNHMARVAKKEVQTPLETVLWNCHIALWGVGITEKGKDSLIELVPFIFDGDRYEKILCWHSHKTSILVMAKDVLEFSPGANKHSIRGRMMRQANVNKARAKIAILLQLTLETADGQRY